MNKSDSHHQFYLPWYAGDNEEDSWITYLHRNLHHLDGEDKPFHDSEWQFNDDDADVHDQVLDALYHSEKVDASRIVVIVVNRSVCLSGTVGSQEELIEAENVVRALNNVWSVTNELVVHEVNV